MQIYFAGSIRGGRKDKDTYLEIINHLKKYGNVLTEHIGNDMLDSSGENNIDDQYIHDRDIDWLLKSDMMIAEVTNPSLGVGYEIGRALENNKKVICLFKNNDYQKLSAMIRGAKELVCIEYIDMDDLKNKINNYISN
tara:strand:+ start:134 stop:547 length:414 start_codon:yes stop_codon:yes gene_type:complete